jgi:hypothetical protein
MNMKRGKSSLEVGGKLKEGKREMRGKGRELVNEMIG